MDRDRKIGALLAPVKALAHLAAATLGRRRAAKADGDDAPPTLIRVSEKRPPETEGP